ncbi:MAG: citrate lyase acyl carrier protein [Treponema sp.]|nr:citrate lyase acyl carrier protein [Treponema sp.]
MEIFKSSVAGTMESSDIMITLEPMSGGIEIELQSIVNKQFGRHIRELITNTLTELQINNVKIIAVDKGALDCTIQARVKTAAYRALEESRHDWRAAR